MGVDATNRRPEQALNHSFHYKPTVDVMNTSYIKSVRAAYEALPTSTELSLLISDAKAADRRGYFNPVEDERIRETFARYLAIRVALWDVIQDLRAGAKRFQRIGEQATFQDARAFSVVFCSAEIIVRTGEYLIDLARTRKIVWQKLDEAEPRYGIKRKSFTRLYRQLTSAYRMHGFYSACETFDAYRDKIFDVSVPEIADILYRLNLPTASRGDHLKRYGKFVGHSLRRRNISTWKKIQFSVFEMMGSDIADLKIPLMKAKNEPKRVSPKVIMDLRAKLEPGDVFVTRHDDAMSNLFLPGFWPHSALWLGAKDADVLEAKKDGVLLRDLEETLQVDAFTILRPKISPEEVDAALTRARTHAGKLYDFVFDFRTSDRLVCTEVIYRTYHGIGPISFELEVQAGRHCLSAEALINQGVSNDWFEVVATYGIYDDKLLSAKAAIDSLRNSFKSTF